MSHFFTPIRSMSMKFEVKIRFQGHISWVPADANSQGQAKALVEQQYGPEVTVLYVKRAEEKD